MVYPNCARDFDLDIGPYLEGRGRIQCLGGFDRHGRKVFQLKRFGKVLASYTWAEKEQAYIRD